MFNSRCLSFQLQNMMTNVVTAFKKMFKENKLFSSESIEAVMRKLNKIHKSLLSPNWRKQDYDKLWKMVEFKSNFSGSYLENILELNRWDNHLTTFDVMEIFTEDKRWNFDILDKNAFYYSGSNALGKNLMIFRFYCDMNYELLLHLKVILPAFTQPPLYQLGVPEYLNYGSMGHFMGHEIGHAFDPNGMKYDEDGNEADLMQKKDREIYREKAKCIENQYNNYTVKDTAEFKDNPHAANIHVSNLERYQ